MTNRNPLNGDGRIPLYDINADSQLDIMVLTACQARCAFCVQEATYKARHLDTDEFLDQVRRHAERLYQEGVRRVVITGGEPLLAPDRVFGVLDQLDAIGRWDVKALYTNGALLLNCGAAGNTVAEGLSGHHLGCVNLSVHHFDDATNNRIFGLPAKPSTEAICAHLKTTGMPFRFNLVLQRPGVNSAQSFCHYVRWAVALGAQDVYAREMFRFSNLRQSHRSERNPVHYCDSNRVAAAPLVNDLVDSGEFALVCSHREWLRDKQESELMHLPTGRTVFVSSLTVGSESRVGNPYLVVMPDGQLYRRWLGLGDRISDRDSESRATTPMPAFATV